MQRHHPPGVHGQGGDVPLPGAVVGKQRAAAVRQPGGGAWQVCLLPGPCCLLQPPAHGASHALACACTMLEKWMRRRLLEQCTSWCTFPLPMGESELPDPPRSLHLAKPEPPAPPHSLPHPCPTAVPYPQAAAITCCMARLLECSPAALLRAVQPPAPSSCRATGLRAGAS